MYKIGFLLSEWESEPEKRFILSCLFQLELKERKCISDAAWNELAPRVDGMISTGYLTYCKDIVVSFANDILPLFYNEKDQFAFYNVTRTKLFDPI